MFPAKIKVSQGFHDYNLDTIGQERQTHSQENYIRACQLSLGKDQSDERKS